MGLTERTATWIAPALRDQLIQALKPIDIHKPGVPAHEVFINVGYQKAQHDFRNILLHTTPIRLEE